MNCLKLAIVVTKRYASRVGTGDPWSEDNRQSATGSRRQAERATIRFGVISGYKLTAEVDSSRVRVRGIVKERDSQRGAIGTFCLRAKSQAGCRRHS